MRITPKVIIIGLFALMSGSLFIFLATMSALLAFALVPLIMQAVFGNTIPLLLLCAGLAYGGYCIFRHIISSLLAKERSDARSCTPM